MDLLNCVLVQILVKSSMGGGQNHNIESMSGVLFLASMLYRCIQN